MVWRQLKKMGALYLQQSVCVVPDQPSLRQELAPILERVQESGGGYHLFPLRDLDGAEWEKLHAQFVAQAAKHYAEIIENCEVNFVKEIEFETFRQNFTYEEAEEIRAEFEKIVGWFERVESRDWFGAENRDQARAWVDRCEELLETFEARVYQEQEAEAPAGDLPALASLTDEPEANGSARREAPPAVDHRAPPAG